MGAETVPDQSTAYAETRRALLDAERELRLQRMRVAELRRQLPLDTVVQAYELTEGPRALGEDGTPETTLLGELFDRPDQPLVVYHLMYGGAQSNPCSMCAMWIDGFNGVARHVDQVVNFAIVAEAPIDDLRNYARQRGWTGLRLLSAAGTTFKRDFGSARPDGGQDPVISVFVRDDDGTVRHFYSGDQFLDQGTEGGLDQLSPVWNLLDLTPRGRGSWYPSREYNS